MPVFHYEAINTAGKVVSGNFTGEVLLDAEKWLQKNGLTPIEIQILADQKDSDQISDTAYTSKKASFKERLLGVTLEDRILFCRQTATMLDSGVAILQSMKIMVKQIKNRFLRQIVLEIAASVESGASLSDSFSRYPKVFNKLFQNVIRTGEESGNLDRAFSYMASLLENEKDVNERIKAATRYPKLVISAMFLAVFFLMSFVVPKFVELFSKSGVDLPLPTRILIFASDAFSNNFLFIIVTIIVIIAGYRICLNYREFIEFRDSLRLKIPVLGDLSKKIYMSRFCRVFSVLTESGIDIIKTLKLSATALENIILLDIMAKITDEVEEGVDLKTAMGKHPHFPALVVQMVAVGEESGQIDAMMGKVADYYEMETDYIIKNLSTLIEPFLLLFMGILVGFIALAIFMPMWNMMNVMRGG